MRRAVKLSLAFVTQAKRKQINALLEAYRAAVNFYIRSLWNERGKLDKATLSRLKSTRLSQRYKSQALKQALEIVIAKQSLFKEAPSVKRVLSFGSSFPRKTLKLPVKCLA
jgi:hypothetical protein